MSYCAMSCSQTVPPRHSSLQRPGHVWTKVKLGGSSTAYPGMLAFEERRPVAAPACMTFGIALPLRPCCGGIAAEKTLHGGCLFSPPTSDMVTLQILTGI